MGIDDIHYGSGRSWSARWLLRTVGSIVRHWNIVIVSVIRLNLHQSRVRIHNQGIIKNMRVFGLDAVQIR